MKKLLATILSLTMVCAFTGCTEDSESSKEKETTTTTATTTQAETSAEEESTADETTTTEESTADETTTDESTTAVESESDSNESETSEVTIENNVVTGPFYTFNIDESKWTSSTTEGVDCMFAYTADADLAGATLNVVSLSSDLLNGISASDYADTVKAQYETMDGYTVTATETADFNGTEANFVDVTAEIGDMKMLMKQIIVPSDENLAVITYGSYDTIFEEMTDEFKAVVDTFSIK